MNKIIFGILLICCYSCKLHKTSHKVEKRTEQEYNAQQITNKQDSLWQESFGYTFAFGKENQWSIIRIKPKGLFTYSPDRGFRGRGEEILLFQNKEQQLVTVDSQYSLAKQGSQVQSKQELHAKETQNEVSIDKKKNQQPMRFWRWLGLVVLVLCFVIVYLKVRY